MTKQQVIPSPAILHCQLLSINRVHIGLEIWSDRSRQLDAETEQAEMRPDMNSLELI